MNTDFPPGLQAAKDSLATTSAVAVTFAFATLYVLVATISTTHVELLLGRDLEIVPLSADVPLLTFFGIVPWIYVGLHYFLLLQLDASRSALRSVRRDWKVRAELSGSILARVLVKDWGRWRSVVNQCLFIVLVMVLPQLLLALIQVQFLPYHLPALPHFGHQFPLLVNCLICLWLVPEIIAQRESSTRRLDPVRLSIWGLSMCGGTFVVLMWLSYAQGGGSQGGGSQGGKLRHFTCRVFECNLNLADEELVGEDRASSWLEIAGGGRSHRTLDLSDRDLRAADFSRSSLVGADFRGANLAGARFRDADLRGADFSPLRSGGSPKRTSLVDADFSRADLREARFSMSLLRRGDLSGADLRGAVLERADLQSVNLAGAWLEAARLSHSILRGSRLDGAHLTCADLEAVRAEGATAVGVVAMGVDLQRARLQGAFFRGADLFAADMTGSVAEGASFRSADLSFSRGLPLLALDLRFADVSGALTNPWDERGPHLTDARGVEAGRSSDPGQARLKSSLAFVSEHLVFRASLARIADCLQGVEERLAGGSDSKMVSVQEQLQEYWWTTILLDRMLLSRAPIDSRISERSFYEELAKGLLEMPTSDDFAGEAALDVCGSRPIAASVLLRAQGCSTPRDPDFEKQLRRRISELVSLGEQCPALAALATTSDSIRKRRGVAHTEPEWPSSERFPRWPRPAADCIELHEKLWSQASQ